jgi:hypothetical protein
MKSRGGTDCTASAGTGTDGTLTSGSGEFDRGGLGVDCTVGSTVVLVLSLAGGGFLGLAAAFVVASTGRGVVEGALLVVGLEGSGGRAVVTAAALLPGRGAGLLVADTVRTAASAGAGNVRMTGRSGEFRNVWSATVEIRGLVSTDSGTNC